MTEGLVPLSDIDPELAGKIEAFKKRGEARCDEFKHRLARFLDQRTHPGDYTVVSCALLEMACERYLDIHEEEDALDLVQRAFRRIVQKRRGPLQ
jgi:hypothetical protein